MKTVHSAARAARGQNGGANLVLVWLIASLAVLTLSAAVDAFSAQATFWTAAKPFMRAAIGAAAAALVVALAHAARFLLTRRRPAAPAPGEEPR